MESKKTKFKYLLGLWKSLPEYPTREDVVYELSSYLVKDGRSGGDFTVQTFNSVFGLNWKKSKHGELIDEMINDGTFDESDKTSGTKKWYRIKDNEIK